MLIAVDFDGVISYYSGWKGKEELGEPILDVIRGLNEIKKYGHKIMVYTCRADKDLVRKFLVENEVPFDYINDSPYNKERGLSIEKQDADVYIDDKSICFDGIWDTDFTNKVLNFRPWWR